MARLAFGGPLEKYPTLKIVTHHAGGMIPYFHKRVQLSWDFNEMRMGYRHDGQTLTSRRSTTTGCSTATRRFRATRRR
jgi:predicted TIM-barrel fold metal-dependent hydrolase